MTLNANQESNILNDSKVLDELEKIHRDLINKSGLIKPNSDSNTNKLTHSVIHGSDNLEMLKLFNNGLTRISNNQPTKDDSELLINMNENLLKQLKSLKNDNDKINKLNESLAKQVEELQMKFDSVNNSDIENETDLQEKYKILNAKYNDPKKLIEKLSNIEDDRLVSLGQKLIATDDFKNLNEQIDNPSLLYLIQKAKKQGHTMVSDRDYNKMYSMTENPPLEFLIEKAKALDQIVVPLAQCESLEQKIENPSLLYLIQKAKLQGYTVISDNDYTNLQTLNETAPIERLKEQASSQLHHLIPSDEYNEMKKNLESPSLLYLVQKAKLQGQTIISDNDYYMMYDTMEKPSLDFLSEKASKLGQKIVSEDVYNTLGGDIENPSLLYLVQKSKLQGQTVISDKDYNMLYSTFKHPSLKFLTEKSRKFGNTVVQTEKYKEIVNNLESPSLLYLVQKSKLQGYTVISDKDYEEMESTTRTPTLEFLKTKAEAIGQIILPTAAYDSLGGSIDSPSLLYLVQKAKLQGQTVISDNDYDSLMQTCHDPSLLHLIEKAKQQGYVVISEKDYSTMLQSSKSPSVEYLDDKSKDSSNTLVSVEDYEQLKSEIELPSLLYLIQKAKEQHYTVISDEDYENMWSTTSDPSLTFLKEKASSLNQTMVASDEYKTMQDVVSHPSLTFLSSMALLKGYQVIEDKTYEQLVKDSSARDEVINLQKENNEIQEKLDNPSIETLKEMANKMNYDILSKSSQADVTRVANDESGVVSESKLKEDAQKLNLKVLSEDEYNELSKKQEPEPMTKDQIIEQIKLNNFDSHNLVGKPKQPEYVGYDDDYDITREDIGDDVVNLRNSAKNFGMLCVPEASFVPTSGESTPDEDNIVVLPKLYYKNLLNNNNVNLSRVNDEDIIQEVKKRGLQTNTSENFTVFSSPNGSQTDEENTRNSTSSSALSKNYTTHVSTKVNVDTTERNSIGAIRTNTSSRSMSMTNMNLTTPRSVKGVPNSVSVNGAVSLAAMVSVTDNGIIPAISQTVIGEFVYKYFNRLGSFGGGETRHRRYMWIHPYTLTLYWSESNPITEDPWNRKTKGVSILNVESVDDNTVGPVKLYNKSIVVTTKEKRIKFTCVDKHRHDVWYNTIKYLIQRNMEGINLKDVFDNPHDELYSGNILSLPENRPRKNSRIVMHSSITPSRRSSRRSSLSRFLK